MVKQSIFGRGAAGCTTQRRVDEVDKSWRWGAGRLRFFIMPSDDLDEVHLLYGQLLFFFVIVSLKPTYSDFSSPLGVLRLSILLSLCLYPSVFAHVLHSTIMDPLFGWTAAALTAYLAGCDSLENVTPTSDGPKQGASVR